MDTRDKILPAEEAIAIAADLRDRNIRYRAVTGFFDVLQPAIIEDLESLAEENAALFAIVLDPPRPLLGSRARLELAAAVRVVDYVVILNGDPSAFIEKLDPDEWFRREEEHLAHTGRLMAAVRGRMGVSH